MMNGRQRTYDAAALASQRERVSGPNTRWYIEPKPPPAEIINAPATVAVEPALTAQAGADERTSAMDRSKALVVRMLPLSVLWLILTVSAGLYWSVEWPLVFLAFAVLTAATYLIFDDNERRYSRNGVERYRIEKAAELKATEMHHQQELRKTALKGYLRMLGDFVDDWG